MEKNLVPCSVFNFALPLMCSCITLSDAASLWPLASDTLHYECNQGQRWNCLYTEFLVPDLAGGRFSAWPLGRFWRCLGESSLGKIWDWDPKETWCCHVARLISFVYMVRIAGSGPALAWRWVWCLAFKGTMAVCANSYLAIGLHSYGFGTGGFVRALLCCAAAGDRGSGLVAAVVVRRRSGQSPFPHAGKLPAPPVR